MSRALLTDGERAAIRDDPDMDDSTKSSHLSRVRAKIIRLREDMELLREHRPDLHEQVQQVVVADDLDERFSELEREVSELKRQIEQS